MLNNYLIYLTFMPWLIVFITYTLHNLNNASYQKFSFKYLTKNFIKLFRIDLLVLIIMFYYFTSFKLEFVSMYLFAVMNIYLFVNSFYDHKNKLKEHFFKNNLLNLILIFLITLIPFLIYIFKHDLDLTYKLMLLYLFLEYPLLIITSTLSRELTKLFKRKKA